MLKDRKLSYSTVNQAASACRFLYGQVLRRREAAILILSVFTRFDVAMFNNDDVLVRIRPAYGMKNAAGKVARRRFRGGGAV